MWKIPGDDFLILNLGLGYCRMHQGAARQGKDLNRLEKERINEEPEDGNSFFRTGPLSSPRKAGAEITEPYWEEVVGWELNCPWGGFSRIVSSSSGLVSLCSSP